MCRTRQTCTNIADCSSSDPKRSRHSCGNSDTLTPSREPGSYVASDPDSVHTPLEFFQLFFDDSIVNEICTNLNKYAEKKKDSKRYMYSRYVKLTPPLLLCIVGLIIYFGLMTLASYRDYWTMSGPAHKLYGVTFAKRCDFSRTKFESIMSFLHISDIDNEDPADRLTKVQLLLDHLNDACEWFYQTYQNISINERMVKSKAQFPMQQYIKNKPVKRCFKRFGVSVIPKTVIRGGYKFTGGRKVNNEQKMGFHTML